MEVIAYTDGSYKEFPDLGGFYSGAAILLINGEISSQVLTQVGNHPANLPLRNVAGEISAVLMACEYCMNTLNMKQGDTLTIMHDYVGIANWCKKAGEKDFWRAKKPLTIQYRDYMNGRVKTRFNVNFQHVKGHAKNAFNNAVDEVAGKAMMQHVEILRNQRNKDA